jgi:hypothetical protein
LASQGNKLYNTSLRRYNSSYKLRHAALCRRNPDKYTGGNILINLYTHYPTCVHLLGTVKIYSYVKIVVP